MAKNKNNLYGTSTFCGQSWTGWDLDRIKISEFQKTSTLNNFITVERGGHIYSLH